MKKNFKVFCQVMMFILAVVSGGMGMAVAVGDNGSDTDPNTYSGHNPDGTSNSAMPKPLVSATHDDPGKGIDQQGKGTTGSAARDAELVVDEINDYVTKFRSYQFPMHTDFLTKAKQIKVDTKEPANFEIGEAILDCNTKTAYTGMTGSTPNYDTSIDLASYLYANDKKLFAETATILVQGVPGYDESGSTVDGSPLMLFVVSKDGSHIYAEPLNGPVHNGEQYVPAIPQGTLLQVMAPALSESEVEVAPDSAYPAEVKHYLQKKACAITWTELFERIKKKAQWNVQDIKDWQLAMFRKKCTRTMLISAQGRKLKTNSKTGTEYVYTQKGILRQLRLGYQINGSWKFSDLVGMAKMLFGKFATSNEMDVYIGPDAMESLTNIDFSEHPEITIEQKLNEVGVGMTALKTPFGTLNFKLEHALEDIGLSKYAIAFNMSDAKRLYYEKGKTINIDHEKGQGGEVREAKSQYYIQDDTLVIKGYNSMLIGPNVAAAGYSNIGTTVTTHTSGSSLPGSPANGDVYYFANDVTVTSGSTSVKYPKGMYEYDGTHFAPYEGVING